MVIRDIASFLSKERSTIDVMCIKYESLATDF